jgi:enamine deaminase RidA (YjgF/YER057c/UK114 family)
MTDTISDRIAELGITLPEAAAPVAAYVPTLEVGNLLFISGQISFNPDGSRITGRLGEDMDTAAGKAAAERCGLMLIAQMKRALGSLDRVERIVKLGAFGARSTGSSGSSSSARSSPRPPTSSSSPRSPTARRS